MLSSLRPGITQPARYAQTIVRRTQWTKASLNRLKKNDLLQLAKKNHLKISGTKNDMVVQLLSHQTAKIVGSSTPTLHSIRESTLKDSFGEETQHNQQQQKKATRTGQEENEETPIDMDWVNAFDTKLSHRGSRPVTSHRTPRNQQKVPIRSSNINRELEKTLQHSSPSEVHQSSSTSPLLQKPETAAAETVLVRDIPSASTVHPNTVTENDVSEMDKDWVKAFEMKVESRGARQRHQLGDTLISKPHHSSSLNEAAFVLKDLPSTAPKKTDMVPIKRESSQNNSKNTFVSAAIGSSMLIWYFGGGEGFSQILHFFF